MPALTPESRRATTADFQVASVKLSICNEGTIVKRNVAINVYVADFNCSFIN